MNSIADHLWQSTLFAGVVWLLTLALRKNRARVRHGLWLAASCKFLIPFSVFIALGSLVPKRTAPAITLPTLVVMDEISQPFTAPVAAAIAPPAPSPFPAILLAVWACGCVGITCSWWVRWRRIRAAVRAGSPVALGLPIKARSSPTLLEPGVFGIFRPILLLPDGIFDRLTPAQLQAVIAHELCHVRHRDNLIATFQMFVETVFWFHPLVWWIGKRMVEERERACDEEVLRDLAEPKAYAEGILNVCKLYVESPLKCVSGVSGSNLKKRIEAIMNYRIVQKLNRGKKLLLAGAGVIAITVPIIVGTLNAPRIRAQPTPAPKFEVASIRPGCGGGASGGASKDGNTGGSQGASPGKLNVCGTLEFFINRAYGNPYRMRFVPIEGAPSWIKSDRYQINAKTEGNPNSALINGPMLQALLEERFRLKIRRETREVSVYDLTVTKNGSKLRPFNEGDCFPGPPALLPQGQDLCGPGKIARNGPNLTIEMPRKTLTEFAEFLGINVARTVVDKTGITGTFDFHLEFAPDEGTPGVPRGALSDEPAGPSIFTALQEQLGLKLESAKGSGEFYVVDHVERPSEN